MNINQVMVDYVRWQVHEREGRRFVLRVFSVDVHGGDSGRAVGCVHLLVITTSALSVSFLKSPRKLVYFVSLLSPFLVCTIPKPCVPVSMNQLLVLRAAD